LVIQEFSYLLIIAFIHLIFVYGWSTKVRNRPIKGRKIWLLCALSSVCTAWGIDALQRIYAIESFMAVAQISFGSWLVFVFATSARHCAINGWSKKEFSLDYGGDLIGFFILGLGIYIIT
jgi:hypothetical protein